MDEFRINPLFKSNYRKLRVVWLQAQSRSTVKDTDHEFLGDVVRPCASVKERFHVLIKNLRHSFVLVATLIVINHVPPILRKLIQVGEKFLFLFRTFHPRR